MQYIQLPENMKHYHEKIEYCLYRLEYYENQTEPIEILVERGFCSEALNKTISANKGNKYIIKEVRIVPLEYKLKDLEDRLKKLEKLYEKEVKKKVIRN